MAKNKVHKGEFITITARKVSDKVQPEIKVGGIYRVNSLDKLKDGTAVLVLDKDIKKGTTVRCNAQRFDWRVISPAEIQERKFKEQSAADTKAITDAAKKQGDEALRKVAKATAQATGQSPKIDKETGEIIEDIEQPK